MLVKSQVLNLYSLILDRLPESDQVINEKRNAESVAALAREMLTSQEFMSRNSDLIATILGDIR
jgi:hypothetical protein